MFWSYNLKYNNTLSFVQSINIIDTTLNLTWYGERKLLVSHITTKLFMCYVPSSGHIANLQP